MQLLADLLPSNMAVGRFFSEAALRSHAFHSLDQGRGAVLEDLIGVQNGRLDQLLDCLRLWPLKVCFELSQLLVL